MKRIVFCLVFVCSFVDGVLAEDLLRSIHGTWKVVGRESSEGFLKKVGKGPFGVCGGKLGKYFSEDSLISIVQRSDKSVRFFGDNGRMISGRYDRGVLELEFPNEKFVVRGKLSREEKTIFLKTKLDCKYSGTWVSFRMVRVGEELLGDAECGVLKREVIRIIREVSVRRPRKPVKIVFGSGVSSYILYEGKKKFEVVYPNISAYEIAKRDGASNRQYSHHKRSQIHAKKVFEEKVLEYKAEMREWEKGLDDRAALIVRVEEGFKKLKELKCDSGKLKRAWRAKMRMSRR